MATTPKLDHLTSADFAHVYEPAEDSFVFLDGLDADRAFLAETLRPRLAIEIGTGSGIVLSHFGALVSGPGRKCALLGVDVNERSARATRATLARNGLHGDVIVGDLAAALGPLHGLVDVALFNPPYVPTPNEEVGTRDLSAAWAGGDRGRVVIDRIVPRGFARLLAPRAALYMILVPDNDLDEIAAAMRTEGFDAHVVLQRRAGREILALVRYTRGIFS